MAAEQPNNSHSRNPADHLKDHRWRDGQSGNPRGRPRGGCDLWGRVQAKMAETTKDGREIADLVAQAILKEALKGNVRILKELLDRDSGVPTQRVMHVDEATIADLLAIGDELEDGDVDARG